MLTAFVIFCVPVNMLYFNCNGKNYPLTCRYSL